MTQLAESMRQLAESMKQLAEIKVVSPNGSGRPGSRAAKSQGPFGTFVPNGDVYLRILENVWTRRAQMGWAAVPLNRENCAGGFDQT